LIYVPTTLIVRGNASATASKILAHQTLFQMGIVADLISSIIFIFLIWALYQLLSGVNKTYATLMVTFVLISAALAITNVLNNVAALTLFRGADFLTAFDKPQRDALGMLFLRLHRQGNIINYIFWGLWLFPFGVLVMRSGFLPRFIGLWLTINCFAYVALSFIGLFAPQYYDASFRSFLPALLGELAIILWLLIKGAKVQPLAARS
jgi:hypothetical protein